MQALLLCLMLSAGYVLPFYLLRTQQARNHPATAKLRMACTVGYCCFAWAPVLLYLGPQVALMHQALSSIASVMYIALQMQCSGQVFPNHTLAYNQDLVRNHIHCQHFCMIARAL